MKKAIIFMFVGYLLLSCAHNNTKQIKIDKQKVLNNITDIKFDIIQDSSIFIPKYSLVKPIYYLKFPKLSKKSIDLYQKNQKKIGNSSDVFLGNTDENDITGHPDIDYDGLTIWNTTTKNRIEIDFYAKKILKYYGFFFEESELLLVTETTRKKNIKTTDSIFFENNHIILWKNSSNKFVTNNNVIKGKEIYILRLIKEIKEIENNEIGYIEKYNYTKDSLSSFVIGNLKD